MRRVIIPFLILLLPLGAFCQTTTLSLSACKDLAVINDPALKNAMLDLESAKAQKGEALAEYFPTISAAANAFHALNPIISIGVTDILGTSDAAYNIQNYIESVAPEYGLPTRYEALNYGYGASIMALQPIYAGGRIVNGNKLAGLGVSAADLKLSLQKRESDDKVEEKYWLVIALQEKLITVDAATVLLDSLEKDVISARDAGLLTDSDFLQVRLKKNEMRSNRIRLTSGIELARIDLCNLIGIEHSDSLVFKESIETLHSPDEYYIAEDVLASQMQETRLLGLQVQAAELQKKMTIGETLPSIGLGASYSYGKYLTYPRGNGALFATLSIPLSDWGKASQRIRRYNAQIQKAKNDQLYYNTQLALKARKMWSDVTCAWEQLAVSDETVELALDNMNKKRGELFAGLATMSEFLQSETIYIQSKEAYIDSCIEYRKALDSYCNLYVE